MSSAWSWYIIIGTVVSLLACFWLVAWTNRQRASEEEIKASESHVWDEDIRELNNPLPMWWLWLFVLTIIWGAGYLIYYPGLGNFAGVGQWSQEAQYEQEVAAAEAAYGPLFAGFGAMPVEQLVKDEKALAIGASLFANYCSQCHGSTAQGARGFPNLSDGEWLWGGSPAQIEQSIVNGRNGVMPALGGIFADQAGIDEMVRYVQGMPDGMDAESGAHSRYMSLCIACHGPTGGGNEALGAPSLVNDSWLYGSSAKEIRKTITEGRSGTMPAHGDLIGPDRARILAAYVYSLSR
ncbi:MAG: cytochrome-c oxidase, cbb3-type subunit III [Gammaproteobacteria bacterium]|nr:MAG: cytochrome-c oxidase, cbb3-type subunit III [Gammaproteobacteria bacterium]